ncbi:MAG: hypothetical protein ACRDOY_09350 [Nocardioidaceae bacterium]
MTPHLGDRTAALVDGQLGYAAREKALRHLTHCDSCRTAVEEERRVKGRVQTMPGAEPSADLLLALTRVSDQPAALDQQLARHLWFPHSRTGLGGLLLAGASTLSVGVLGLAYVVGGATAPAPNSVSPPVGRFSVEFADPEPSVRIADPATEAFPGTDTRARVGGR